jgi:hypothetical protein
MNLLESLKLVLNSLMIQGMAGLTNIVFNVNRKSWEMISLIEVDGKSQVVRYIKEKLGRFLKTI